MAQARGDAGLTSGLDQVRKLSDALGRRDVETVSELLDPDVVWEHNIGVGSPEEGVYHGRDDVLELFGRILEVWESLRAEPHEIRELRDGAFFVRGELRGKHAISAAEVVSSYEQRLELRDRLLVKGRMATVEGPGLREGAEVDAPADSLNIARVRDFIEAFNRLDLDSLVDGLDPAVELSEWPAAPGAQTFHGREGARRALEGWFEVWEWMQVEIEDVLERDDRVVVTLYQRAKGRGSSVEVEIRSFNVYTFRDGRMIRLELFTEREPALEAAGLTPNHEQEKR